MEFDAKKSPREFSPLAGITLRDTGTIRLDVDEQVTFVLPSGKTNDVARKAWGYYLSNSLNWNLSRQGFKTALVVSYASEPPRLYINLVDTAQQESFNRYLETFNAKVVTWLDEWEPTPDGE
jgi:hypothetical protein